jgi:hypothetical protein
MAHLMRLKEQGGSAWPAAPKALLLSPTHELAAQTARVLKLLLPGSGLRCCLLSKKSEGEKSMGFGAAMCVSGAAMFVSRGSAYNCLMMCCDVLCCVVLCRAVRLSGATEFSKVDVLCYQHFLMM